MGKKHIVISSIFGWFSTKKLYPRKVCSFIAKQLHVTNLWACLEIELSTGLDSNPDLDSNQVDLDLDLDSGQKGVDLDLDLDSRQRGGFGFGFGFEVPGFAHH